MDEPNHLLQGKRALVVEDEPRVAMMVEDLLRDLGCEVVGLATRVDEATAKAETLSFDIALLDVNLGDKQSFPVAEAIAARGLPFVFTTGYSASALPEAFRNRPVLQKPYWFRDLKQVLVSVLSKECPGE
ncbi:MAG TPA: response regulator [Rhodanobacteraceae bacterium]|nr:response regulator [Rhodanobacteraceae bacterium]